MAVIFAYCWNVSPKWVGAVTAAQFEIVLAQLTGFSFGCLLGGPRIRRVDYVTTTIVFLYRMFAMFN